MTILQIIGLLLWLLLGLLSVMGEHYTYVKTWYIKFNEHPDEFEQNKSVMLSLYYLAIPLILSGLFSFILILLINSDEIKDNNFTFYFKIPKNENLNT